MSTNRSRRIDRDTAERLLGGDAVDAPGGAGALSRLLEAAAAPATGPELTGEEEAVTAFREAARLAPTRPTVPAQRSRPMAACTPRPRVPARFLGARAAVAALAVTALGGVAVAAGGGLPALIGGGDGNQNLPSQNAAVSTPVPSGGGRHADAPTAPPGRPIGGRQLPGGSTASPQSGAASADTPPGQDPGSVSGAAAAAMPGLCALWSKGQQGSPDPRFEPLTRAAGGSDRVRAFCDALGHDPDTAAPGDPGGSADSGGAGGAGDDRPGDHPSNPAPGHGRSPAPTAGLPHPSATPQPPTRTPGAGSTRSRPADGSGGGAGGDGGGNAQ
ncbi:hypothetical protein [Kitasatospora viridis]|uniref:Uncharacterized protein n=1 Tax=Kitasatospora viridis TaxID=281105 RepID=A0A561UAU1_9ACTN|nr:hypothetical protein [Kitasatospora viridis]TWF96491.1 hypothetical protein FHX73_11263 [Kitasatospora viridis]